MQSQGSLSDNSLRNLLETAQGERATGILTVHDGDRTATLYLLFGSLVHAEAAGQVGDAAVVSALGWNEGEFAFDSKAKLPADETVTGTLADLISAADAAARNGGSETPQTAPTEPDAEPTSAEGSFTETPMDAEAEAEGDSEPAREAQAAEPEPAPVEAPTLPPTARPEPHVPQPRRGVKHRPEPRHGREPIPVPAGEVTYDSLKTSFVDFPRLVTTLERDGYTGYVRLLTDEASGLIFFSDGRALECVYDGGQLLLGRDALREFNDQVTRGLGVLDVVGLTPEVVEGLYELTVATPLYTELYASWVDFPSLLEFLAERTHTGSVTVRSAGKTGVIIFTTGKVTGAYTSESRDISGEVDQVRSLCADPQAMIEVKAAEETHREPLNVEDITGQVSSRPDAYRPPPAAPEVEAAPAGPAPDPAATIPPAAATIPPAAAAGDTLPPVSSGADTIPPEATPAATIPPQASPAEEGKAVDWDRVVDDLQQLAEESLGNRSRKVKDILAGAERSRAGVERAIDEIPTISLLFVDSSRLEALAQDMRTRLQSEL